MRPGGMLQPKDKSIRYENVRSAAAEEGIIRLLMTEPDLLRMTEKLAAEDFTSPFLGKTYSIIKERYDQGLNTAIPQLSSCLEAAEISQLTVLMQRPESMRNSEQAIRDYIETIKTEQLKKTARDDLRAVTERYREKKGYGG